MSATESSRYLTHSNPGEPLSQPVRYRDAILTTYVGMESTATSRFMKPWQVFLSAIGPCCQKKYWLGSGMYSRSRLRYPTSRIQIAPSESTAWQPHRQAEYGKDFEGSEVDDRSTSSLSIVRIGF